MLALIQHYLISAHLALFLKKKNFEFIDSSDRKSTVIAVLCGTGNARGSTLAKTKSSFLPKATKNATNTWQNVGNYNFRGLCSGHYSNLGFCLLNTRKNSG